MVDLWVSILCSIHLTAGFLVGRHTMRIACNSNRELVIELLEASRQAREQLETNRSSVPEQVVDAVGQLHNCIEKLIASIKPAIDINKAKSRKLASNRQRKKKGRRLALCSPDEGKSVSSTNPNDRGEQKDDHSATAHLEGMRFPYRVSQYIARIDSDPGGREGFELVTCRHLSRNGVTFYVSQQLGIGESIVISLGLPDEPRLLCAYVTSVRAAVLGAEICYFVECEFSKERLSNLPYWQELFDRDITSKSTSVKA